VRDELLRQAKRVVIKIGSSLVASRETGLSAERIERLAGEIAEVRAQGREVLVVSSGAVVSGIKKLGLREYPKSLPLKQAAAAVGQSLLMWAYEKAFERLTLRVAQVLLTHEDLADRRRFLNARHTLTTLIKFGVIPIINENDTVAVEEIRVGDNDTLAAQVAHLVDADLLIILSDVDGLFTVDPRKDPTASLIPLIPEITKDIEQRAGMSSTFEGTGGMATKVRAAKKVGGIRRRHPDSKWNPDTTASGRAVRAIRRQPVSRPGTTLDQSQTLDCVYSAAARPCAAGSGSRRGPGTERQKPPGIGHPRYYRPFRRRRSGDLRRS
jgi:glutamate 5-kinase